MICNQVNLENMCISITWGLVSLESFDQNSEKLAEFYKADNCINNIGFGAYLFVSCDLIA